MKPSKERIDEVLNQYLTKEQIESSDEVMFSRDFVHEAIAELMEVENPHTTNKSKKKLSTNSICGIDVVGAWCISCSTKTECTLYKTNHPCQE